MNKCKWCGRETMRGDECDSCWELRWRIDFDIYLAAKMLTEAVKNQFEEIMRLRNDFP